MWSIQRNPRPPDKFEKRVNTALRYTDEHVWIYTEAPWWWSDKGGPVKLPPAYDAAIRRAASSPTVKPTRFRDWLLCCGPGEMGHVRGETSAV